MTLLVLDVGNTRIKWGLRAARAWVGRGHLPTASPALLATALAGGPALRRVVGSNVAGAQAAAAVARSLGAGAPAPEWLVPQREQAGLTNGYALPATLGPDRWAAAVAAWHRVRGPVLVVGAGTAVTVDAVDGSGHFLGGLILPGAALMASSLHRATARLPLATGQVVEFPDGSDDAITSGAVHAVCGAVERMQAFLARRCGSTPEVLVGGGDGALLLRHLRVPARAAAGLVLEGLLHVAGEPSA